MAEQLGLFVLLENVVSDLEFYGLCVAGEEEGVDGLGGIGDEVGEF